METKTETKCLFSIEGSRFVEALSFASKFIPSGKKPEDGDLTLLGIHSTSNGIDIVAFDRYILGIGFIEGTFANDISLLLDSSTIKEIQAIPSKELKSSIFSFFEDYLLIENKHKTYTLNIVKRELIGAYYYKRILSGHYSLPYVLQAKLLINELKEEKKRVGKEFKNMACVFDFATKEIVFRYFNGNTYTRKLSLDAFLSIEKENETASENTIGFYCDKLLSTLQKIEEQQCLFYESGNGKNAKLSTNTKTIITATVYL